MTANVTDATFADDVLASDLPVLVDFAQIEAALAARPQPSR
jgi:hypothetical protein